VSRRRVKQKGSCPLKLSLEWGCGSMDNTGRIGKVSSRATKGNAGSGSTNYDLGDLEKWTMGGGRSFQEVSSHMTTWSWGTWLGSRCSLEHLGDESVWRRVGVGMCCDVGRCRSHHECENNGG
jgi:hypothetical protein